MTDPTPGGWPVALACELEAAYYSGVDRGPPTVDARWLQVANHVAAQVEAARREEREAAGQIARSVTIPEDCSATETHGRMMAAIEISRAIRARGDA